MKNILIMRKHINFTGLVPNCKKPKNRQKKTNSFFCIFLDMPFSHEQTVLYWRVNPIKKLKICFFLNFLYFQLCVDLQKSLLGLTPIFKINFDFLTKNHQWICAINLFLNCNASWKTLGIVETKGRSIKMQSLYCYNACVKIDVQKNP